MKKGFSLLETVIALSVIMLISVGFFSLSTFANTQFKKMQIKEHGIVLIENAKAVFDNSTNVINFSTNLQWATGLTLTEQAPNTFSAMCKVNSDGSPNENGLGAYQITLQESTGNIILNAKIFYKDKEIYSMPIYQKVVTE